MRYAIVIEKAGSNYSTSVPDLPGCFATAATVQEIKIEIKNAIRFHFDGIQEDGLAVPVPTTMAEYIEASG